MAKQFKSDRKTSRLSTTPTPLKPAPTMLRTTESIPNSQRQAYGRNMGDNPWSRHIKADNTETENKHLERKTSTISTTPPPSEVAVLSPTTLPPGWTEHKTANGQVYYFNANSGQSSWSLPKEDSAEIENEHSETRTSTVSTTPVSSELAVSSPTSLPPGWTEHKTPNGQVYYFNANSGQSSCSLPKGDSAEIENKHSEADLLHPLATVHWEQCYKWKNAVIPTHCAVLHNTVAVLQMGSEGSGDVLHTSSIDLMSWTASQLPLQHMSLTTYKSKFVAIGGKYPTTDEASDVLFSSATGIEWQQIAPSMKTKRWKSVSVSTKSPEILVVAGGLGLDNHPLNVVEVLLENFWTTVAPLPKPIFDMHSVFLNENLYFFDGVIILAKAYAYTCSISSLISSMHDATKATSIWNEFESDGYSAYSSFSTYLVHISKSCDISAYSTLTKSWLKASSTRYQHARGPTDRLAAAPLPSGNLVCAHSQEGVFRVKLLVSSFDPDSQFMPNALSRLEAVMSVPIMSVLANSPQDFGTSSGVILQPRHVFGVERSLPNPQTAPIKYVEEVVLQWTTGHSHRPATWRELLHVLQQSNLLQLKQQIETFLKDGVLVKSSELVESDVVQAKEFSLIDYPSLPKCEEVTKENVLPGFSATDEVSVQYKGQSGSLEMDEYGLTLLFESSEDSTEVKECPVRVMTGETGAFRYPEKVESVSSVYHIDSPKQLPAPVTIRIKHSVPDEDIQNLCFMTCSEDQPPYDYVIVKGGNFTSTYAEITVQSFSFYVLGVLKKFGVKGILSIKEKSYAASLHCNVQPKQDESGYEWNVYVSIVKNCSCFKRSIKKYISEEYEEDVDEIITEVVSFADKNDRISAITSYEHSPDWDVSLDSFKSESIKKIAINKYVDATLPHIRYKLRVAENLENAFIKIKITLVGLQEPENFLRLQFKVPQNQKFTMRNLRILKIGSNQELYLIEEISPQWKAAGELLGLRISQLRVFEDNHPRNIVHCCADVMSEWLNDKKGIYTHPPCWEGLCRLLEELKLSAISLRIKKHLLQ